MISRLSDRKNPRKLADKLVEVGLWIATDDGWEINDYLEFQPSRETVLKQREEKHEKKAAAGRMGGIASGAVRRGEAEPKQNRSNDEAEPKQTVKQTGSKHEAPTRTRPDTPTTTSDGGGGVHVKQVAMDAASLLLEHETNVERPGAWKARVAERLLNDYDLTGIVREFGTEAARHVYSLEKPRDVTPVNPYAARPPEHDPNCEHCAGSGWRTIDFDRNTVGPCDCTPTIATVTELRTA